MAAEKPDENTEITKLSEEEPAKETACASDESIQPAVIKVPPKFNLKRFLYNEDEGTVMGRTGMSWLKIFIFYVIFYTCLAIFILIFMWCFFLTINEKEPKYLLDSSLIGTNPGMGYRPDARASDFASTLISFKIKDRKTYSMWTKNLEEFIRPYKDADLVPGRSANLYECSYLNPPPPGKVCRIRVSDFDRCNEVNEYEYPRGSPCVFIKLNKIFGWIPEYYNNSRELPDYMPDSLKERIRNTDSDQMNTVWVTCDGEHPMDKEHIGPIKYYPRQGFPSYFYPFNNTQGYLSPIIAVHFMAPSPGILISIECKAWAKNIHHDSKERLGLIHFELLVDKY